MPRLTRRGNGFPRPGGSHVKMVSFCLSGCPVPPLRRDCSLPPKLRTLPTLFRTLLLLSFICLANPRPPIACVVSAPALLRRRPLPRRLAKTASSSVIRCAGDGPCNRLLPNRVATICDAQSFCPDWPLPRKFHRAGLGTSLLPTE